MTLLLGVLLASVVGSVHCAAMCGGFVCLYAGGGAGARTNMATHAAYNAGRLVSYVTLGLAAGALGARLDRLGAFANVERAAAVIAGVLMIVWASVLIGTTFGVRSFAGGAPAWIQKPFGALLLTFRDQAPVVRAAATGLVTTLLPCGWLYAFTVTAGGTGHPIAGAAVMAVFWLGTLPMMVGLGVGVGRIAPSVARRLPLVSALLVFALGAMSLAGKLRPLSLSDAAHTTHVHR
jgi:sulfite exporter TauE/SafE